MRTVQRLAGLSVLLLASACSSVSVTDSGSGIHAAPRASDCRVEFFRTKLPERPYDELATLHYSGTLDGAGSAQQELRARACDLGADAVVVTRDFVPGTQQTRSIMTATAIKYRSAPLDAEKVPASATAAP